MICFSRKRENPTLRIVLYEQMVKQVQVIRFLGVWMDSKMTFGEHIQRGVMRCKKAINVMRCLAGSSWGSSMNSLKQIYTAIIRSSLDYACFAYSSAAKSQLIKCDVIQAQAIQLCCGAFKTLSVQDLQVEKNWPSVVITLRTPDLHVNKNVSHVIQIMD